VEPLETVLERLVETASELVDARYAALGIPDEERTGFARFITSGMSAELIAALGPLPRTHGLLGAMLTDRRSFRTADISSDPRFRGWWPAAHPTMRSFLGVPIEHDGAIVGAFYLTDKRQEPAFDARDQRLIEVLASHAGLALENARLLERQRELGVLEERARLARELHDAISQTLFSLHLLAHGARDLVLDDPAAAVERLDEVATLAGVARRELRELVDGLQPADLESDGLASALARHVAILRRAYGVEIAVAMDGLPALAPQVERELYAIVREALANALRHAAADRITVSARFDDGRLRIDVVDDGIGFDPADGAIRGRRLGLTSMAERAAAIGGTLRIESRTSIGTTVAIEVPGG